MEIVNGRRAITFGAHRRRIKQSKGSSAWLMCRDLRVLDSTAIQAQEAALDLEHRMIMIRAALANQAIVCTPTLLALSPRKSGEGRWRVGSDESGTFFVVPHSKTLRVTVPRQQPDQALPQAKPIDFIGVPDLGETMRWGDVARSALECGARHEAPLCRSSGPAKAKPFSDRPARGVWVWQGS